MMKKEKLHTWMKKLALVFSCSLAGLLAGNLMAASEYCEYLMGNNVEQYAYITFETDENGNVLITLAPYNGDTDTAFRGNGYADGAIQQMTVNGEPNTDFKYFTRTITDDNLQVILTPVPGMMNPGDVININQTIEYKTSLNGNLWPTFEFNYIYGSNCEGVAKVSVNPESVVFTPDENEQVVFISGESIVGDLTLTAPKGITVSPQTLSPNENGIISDQLVVIGWVEGAYGASVIISGGGLRSDKNILITTDGLSEYCNRVIVAENDAKYPVYMSLSQSDDKKELIFDIAPYNENETAVWNNNSIQAANILIDGVAPATPPVRTMENENTTIVITFDEPLEDGQVITFGAPTVWTAKDSEGNNLNANCYINAAFTYVAGTGCDIQGASYGVKSIDEEIDLTHNRAEVVVALSGGAVKVQFSEDNNLVGDIILDRVPENTYLLEGLTQKTAYSFTVTALNANDVASEAYAEKLVFTTPSSHDISAIGNVRNITHESATVQVLATGIATQIKLTEEQGLVGPFVFDIVENNRYIVDGLTEKTTYTFIATALDADGVESDPAEEKITFTTTATHGIVSVSAPTNITDVKAEVTVEVMGRAVKVHFSEDGNLVENIVLDIVDHNTYVLEGLREETSYTFTVTALDADDNHSDPHTEKLTFTTLKPSSVALIGESGISVYPVPAKEVLYIAGLQAAVSVQVTDIQGKPVKELVTAGEMPVSDLPAGVYLLSVEGQTIKFIKE